MSIIKVIEISLVLCDQWRMISDLNMSHGKISYLVSFLLFEFTLVIKLRSVDLESHSKYFFDKKRYGVRFDYVSWKSVWFCIICIVLVCFSHKMENFRFWKSLKYSFHFNIFLIKNNLISDLNMSCKQCLICFKHRCLSKVLARSW